MATNFPTSADDGTTLPNPTASSATNSPSISAGQSNQNDAIKALEAKVGTGASTPTNNTLLRGNGTGTSTWAALTSAQMAASMSDETGSGSLVFATTPTLVTPKVDTINESTPSNGTTIGGVNIKSGALVTSASVPTAALQDSAVTSAKVATGMPVQIVSSSSTAVATTTALIPLDDTIPQITEGAEFMTQTITPKSATNTLVIDATLFISPTIANHIIGALFQDATANALAASDQYITTGGGATMLRVTNTMTAGTTSSTTFRIRVGALSAGTLTFNGIASGRLFGAINKSVFTITEYKA